MGISRATIRAINILDKAAKSPKGITLSEVANYLDIPITSASDIIKALIETEMIEVLDSRSKLYGIGVKAYYIGSSYLTNSSIVDKARPIIDKLGKKMSKTIFLGKEVSGKITYIYKYAPQNPLVATCKIGDRTNLHCTSLGKSILAYDDKLLLRMKDQELIRKTDKTITDYDQLKKEIERVRENGFAIDELEQNSHLTCVGAPIFDHNGIVIAAISATGLHASNRDIDTEGRTVKNAAQEISRTLGYV